MKEFEDKFKTKDQVTGEGILKEIRRRNREANKVVAPKVLDGKVMAGKVENELPKLFSLKETEAESKLSKNLKSAVNHTSWDYIATFVIDMRNSEDYQILHHEFTTLRGDMDAECYYSECVSNADLHEILPTDHYGHYTNKYDQGVFRMVFGVNARGDSYDTTEGVEHESWEEYDLISDYQLTEKEIEVCFGKDMWIDLEHIDEVNFDSEPDPTFITD